MPDEFEDPSADKLGDPGAAGRGGEAAGDPRILRAEAELLPIEGVEGVGLGRSETGADAILVYVSADDAAARLPKSFAGLPVVIERTGPIDAY